MDGIKLIIEHGCNKGEYDISVACLESMKVLFYSNGVKTWYNIVEENGKYYGRQ